MLNFESELGISLFSPLFDPDCSWSDSIFHVSSYPTPFFSPKTDLSHSHTVCISHQTILQFIPFPLWYFWYFLAMSCSLLWDCQLILANMKLFLSTFYWDGVYLILPFDMHSSSYWSNLWAVLFPFYHNRCFWISCRVLCIHYPIWYSKIQYFFSTKWSKILTFNFASSPSPILIPFCYITAQASLSSNSKT